MGKVIPFKGKTMVDIPPSQILEAAPKDLLYVLVIGIDKDGERYYASSESDLGRAFYEMEKLKLFALDGGDGNT
jgi:hypothetical protein